VALDIRDQDQDIHILDLTRNTITRLTFEKGADISPIWTPDGERIVYSKPTRGLVMQRADGTGVIEELTTQKDNLHTATSVTADGKRVIFNDSSPTGDFGIATVILDSKHDAEVLLQTTFDELNVSVSPDQRWIAYQSLESGQMEVYVRPFPDVHIGRWQVSTKGGTRPLWAKSGRELFYISPDGAMTSVRVDTRNGFHADNPVTLFRRLYFTGLLGRSYDVAPDGERFLMIKDPAQSADASRIIIVENWFEELKQRVPVN
jgi:Tol biopolymer transport system component